MTRIHYKILPWWERKRRWRVHWTTNYRGDLHRVVLDYRPTSLREMGGTRPSLEWALSEAYAAYLLAPSELIEELPADWRAFIPLATKL